MELVGGALDGGVRFSVLVAAPAIALELGTTRGGTAIMFVAAETACGSAPAWQSMQLLSAQSVCDRCSPWTPCAHSKNTQSQAMPQLRARLLAVGLVDAKAAL